MATVHVVNGSPAWHAERATGIGGSECASLFNAGPYACTRRLIMEKRGIVPDYMRTPREEAVLERGNELEDVVADKFVRETGLKVRRQPARVSKTHPHARVNMDRQMVATDVNYLLALTTDKVTGISPLEKLIEELGEYLGPGQLECKTINEHDYKRLVAQGFEKHEHYILQQQHGFAVTGYEWGIFAFLEPTYWQFTWFLVTRNDALCEEILRRVEETWKLVEDDTLPLPDRLADGAKQCSKCLWRKTCRGEQYLAEHAGADFASDYVTVEDANLYELAADYVAAEEAADQASAIVDEIKTRIKAEMAEKNLVKIEVPNVIKLSNVPVKGRAGWDSKALEGEVNALSKSEDAKLIEIGTRIANCKKVGAPSTQFRTYSV